MESDRQVHARCIEPLGRAGDHSFADETLAHTIGERVETWLPDTAGQICAGSQRARCSVHNVRRIVMALVDVDNRSAIGNDEAPETPGLSQMLLQQHPVRAGTHAVNGVIGAHH